MTRWCARWLPLVRRPRGRSRRAAPRPTWRAAALAAAALLVALLPARPADAQSISLPVALRRGAVFVRAERGMERIAERVAESARDSLRAIAEDLPGLPTPRSVEIRLVKRAEDLALAAPPGRGAPPWAIGVAYPDANVVVAAYRRGPVPGDIDAVVIHELAHLALGAALGPRAPRWLHEGFAYRHSSEFSLERARTLTGMAWSGDVIPLAELDRSFPAAEDAAQRAYAQSYDFVNFLARRGRYQGPEDDGNPWPFRQLLADLARGESLDQAARSQYTSSLQQLFDEWRASLRDRYLTIPASVLGAALWVLCAVLLILAFVRKRRQGRVTLARWADEEAGQPAEDSPEEGDPTAADPGEPADAPPAVGRPGINIPAIPGQLISLEEILARHRRRRGDPDN